MQWYVIFFTGISRFTRVKKTIQSSEKVFKIMQNILKYAKLSKTMQNNDKESTFFTKESHNYEKKMTKCGIAKIG